MFLIPPITPRERTRTLPSKTPKKIPILHFGLGPVGRRIATLLQEATYLQSVAGVDSDPKLVGQNLAQVLDMPSPQLEKVVIGHALTKTKAKVAIHATRSWLSDIEDQLAMLLNKGLNVVSTAEELVFPVGKNKKIIGRLDKIAKRKKVCLIGVGVNPGFVLDLLPATVGRVVHNIKNVKAVRVVDLRKRRLPLQAKVGLALSPAEFSEKLKDKTFGHQGMRESLHLLAAGLGVDIKRTYLATKPIISDIICETRYFRITPGVTRGIYQEAVGYVGESGQIRLELKMIVGSEKPSEENIADSFDEIDIEGTPSVNLKIPGGIFGEDATAAAVLRIIPRLVEAKPGYHTVLDV